MEKRVYVIYSKPGKYLLAATLLTVRVTMLT